MNDVTASLDEAEPRTDEPPEPLTVEEERRLRVAVRGGLVLNDANAPALIASLLATLDAARGPEPHTEAGARTQVPGGNQLAVRSGDSLEAAGQQIPGGNRAPAPDPSSPRTDAGDALDYEVGRLTGNTDGEVSRAVRAAIPRIREQAATEARRELDVEVLARADWEVFGGARASGSTWDDLDQRTKDATLDYARQVAAEYRRLIEERSDAV
jgi:hypothetical protein